MIITVCRLLLLLLLHAYAMLGSQAQSTQANSERSRPRSRLLAMKERLRLQRQRSQPQSIGSGNCQTDAAKQCSTSAASESYPSADTAQAPVIQSPVKGRRFQRSRHAEQQARSRSQDAATTVAKKDGFLGCAGGPRPLQKSKSVDMNLEKIVQVAGTNSRSNTVSVEVEKLAASGSRKVEKKGSFLFRSSSLLARLSGRSGQKKLQSPSPLRRDGPQSASVENPDDSVIASVNQSVASSTSSKTASLSESGHLEVLASFNSVEVEDSDPRQQLQAGVVSICHPTPMVQSLLGQTQQTGKVSSSASHSTNDRSVCRCSTFVKSSHNPLSRPPRVDSKFREKAATLEHASEIMLAAEMRQGLPRQTSEGWLISSTHSDNCCSQPQAFLGESETAKKLTFLAPQPSVSSGNLLNRMPQVRNDSASNGINLNGVADTSAKVCVATVAPLDLTSLDAVAMTTTSAREQQHSKYSQWVSYYTLCIWWICQNT